ncbi:MAG: DNA mismatch repair endonuclease MutL, partial [Gemmataceae bacterium]
LASIGGVAQVTLQSRPTQAEQGAMIECRGSTLSPVRAWNGAIGTRIEVRNLFFNTPVRRKFLRTPGTEMGHISEAIIRLALAFPCCDDQSGLNLVLRHNGKVVHDIPSTTTLRDRVERFFGPEVSASLLPVIGEAGPVRLRGFVADPSCDRGNSRTQYLYVNGRWIRDRNLGHALQESYRGLLMTGRYAVAFLFLDMPPDQVDVNVHPTKSEVRFRQVSSLHHLVYTAVKKALGHTALIPNLQLPSSMQTGSFQAARPVVPPLMVHPPEVFSRPMTSNADDPIQQRTPPIREEGWIQSRTEPTREQAPLQPFPERGPPPLESLDRALFPPPRSARAIQLYDAYLVVETDEGMLVIDQHALHERILFEQIQKRLREKTLPSQPLLIPEPIDLPSGMAAQLLEHESTLAELGLGIEEFGGDTVLLTRYPLILEKRSPRETLLAVVDHLAQQDRLPTRDVFLNDLVSVMAC